MTSHDSYISLAKLCRGAKLFLKNNEEVLYIKKDRTRITVLGDKGLKNVSYHQICVDKMYSYYTELYKDAA